MAGNSFRSLALLSPLLSLLFLLGGVEGAIPENEIVSAINGRSMINIDCSENVEVFNQGSFKSAMIINTAENCPHKDSTLTKFEAEFGVLTQDSSVSIPSGKKVLLSSSSLPSNPSHVIQRITVGDGASLVFDDVDMMMRIREIYVEEGGHLWIGSETCRVQSKIEIIFSGSKSDSSTSGFSGSGTTSKGLIVKGEADIHGKQFHPTWTRLSLTAEVGETLIFLGDRVNWEVGQQILVTPSVYYDCPEVYKSSCNNEAHQNEVFTISDISMNPSTGTFVLKLDRPLTYEHYAGPEYQSEVVLLSRNLKFTGSDSGDNFGGHTAIVGTGKGRFSGIQGENLGQLNILGRYPFHFHLVGDLGAESYFKDLSVTNSQFRAYVVHGTNKATIARCVSYNVMGFAFYIEDGVEEENVFEYNLAAHTHPVKQPADGGWGQGGETFSSAADLIIPADTSASGFYISNAYNSFVGNAASGGWSGFAFPNLPLPIGDFKGEDRGDKNPERRPTLEFRGNTAHSTGMYWRGHGNAIYVGADLYYENNVLTYKSGRNSRDTRDGETGERAYMYFEHTKVWCTHKGIAHWGDRVEITHFEAHDIRTSAMIFGSSAMSEVISNGHSGNTLGLLDSQGRMGFQFYDTWSKAILSRVTFRNYKGDDDVIRTMDHSDQFLPQGINAIRALKFENIEKSLVIRIDRCGPDCGELESASTMSSKIYNIWDYDGTLTQTGKPSILGTNRDWWNVGSDCEKITEWGLWRCDWTENRQIVHIRPTIPGLMEGCDSTYGCSGQKASYTVGWISQFGDLNKGISMSPWPGVSGISNNGWYWRPKFTEEGLDGAPSEFFLDRGYQISKGHFIVLAVRYPSQAQFEVRFTRYFSTTHFILPMSTKEEVLTKTEDLLDPANFVCTTTGVDDQGGDTNTWLKFCEETGGVGPAWHFDGTHLFIRVVNPHCYTTSGKDTCQNDLYEFDGAKIWNVNSIYDYSVKVTSCSGCTVQKTFEGVDYYDVTDEAPAAFGPVAGSLRAKETPVFASSKTCPFEIEEDPDPSNPGENESQGNPSFLPSFLLLFFSLLLSFACLF